jgi:large subunit ribosomal protein L13
MAETKETGKTTEIVVIDGTDMILGRLATKVAKWAIEGKAVEIINAEKVVIIGKKTQILARYTQHSRRGTHTTGPFTHRGADRLVRRSVRGMIPYKTTAGSEAYKRVMCHIGNPDLGEGKTFDDINVHNTDNVNYLTMADISKHLGGKI